MMKSNMQRRSRSSLWRRAAQLLLAISTLALGGCEDPHVYGSVGVSSGYGGYYGGYGGWGQPRMHTSISIGGRIR